MCIYAFRNTRSVLQMSVIDSKRLRVFHIEYHGNMLLILDISVLGCDALPYGMWFSRFRSTVVSSFAYVLK